jgi:UDPglucose 6-dehydrogenase
MNMIATLCSAVGADIDMVRKGVGSDSRIGSSFLFAGAGYGGSCFPKDVKALIQTLQKHHVNASILTAVEKVNEGQKHLLLDRVVELYGNDLSNRTFAIWGLSFKPETDDMREAPSLVVVNGLVQRGARVRVHDPEAMSSAREHFADTVEYCTDNYDAVKGADGLLILTEWRPYRRPDFEKLGALLGRKLVLDGRNLFEPARMHELGFEYISIGRPVYKPENASA